ncbi:MAG: type-F conjugative transfer system protein TraW [Pacificimonas sp.]
MRSQNILLTGLLTASVAMLAAAKASAADYGVRGEVFPVVETDLLGTIETRLHAMQASGKIDDVNRRLAARTTAKVKRPPRVDGIGTATQTRVWTFDPSITAPENIFDNRGMLIVARGTRVNPLDHVPLRQALVFLDGDDPAQVEWANIQDLNAKLILIGGSPFDRMKAAQRRFYFDQGGKLTTHFGIRAVPATVEQQGRTLRISEISLAAEGASQ